MTFKVSTRPHQKVHTFISKDGSFRVSTVVATQVVDEMRSILNTYPIATVALGRSMMGCLLMASHQKQGHSVGMYIRGSGPLGLVFAEATYEGACRAYTANPQLELPPKNGYLDISGAIGHGLLEVVRGVSYTNQLHSGTVIIKTGEIGEDIAFYLQQSQQIPAVVAVGVEIDQYGLVRGAGGLLVELFPNAKENTITKIEESIAKASSLSKLVSSGGTAEDIVKEFLKGFELEPLPHENSVRYECRCSLEKVKNALMLLGPDELKDMLKDNIDVEASCDFCGRHYIIPLPDLQELHRESHKRSLN